MKSYKISNSKQLTYEYNTIKWNALQWFYKI